jgi:acyl-CoA synthetase (AMP-forming)/AMP-acid ligase II
MTYAELSRAAERVAGGLRAHGLGPGDRVFIFIPMVAELYVTLFGVLRLGAVAVFLDSWARRDQLAACARQVEPRGFVGPAPAHDMIRCVTALQDGVVAVRVGPGDGGDVSLQELTEAGAPEPVAPVLSTDSALVTFTTGSSGVPKGADRTHGFLVAQHEALDAEIPYGADDVDLPVFPVFSLNNLAAGVTTVLPDLDLAAPSADDGARLLRQMNDRAVTCSTLSPSLLRSVTASAADGGSPPSLRRVVTGGAPVSRDDAEAFAAAFPQAKLHILYGSTEVEPIAHLRAEDLPPSGGGVCLGRPSPALELRFIRPTPDPVSLEEGEWAPWAVDPREGGELLVAGPHVCPGYFRNPEAFGRAKVRDGHGRVWHRTGDVCVMDDDGHLWMLGRVHNAIRRGDELLFPVEAELLMNRLPPVERAAYLGMPDPGLHEAAWAVFTVKEGGDASSTASMVESALTAEGIPVDGVVCVPEIPMDPRHHSKVDVDALRSRLLEGAGEAST